MTGRNNVPSNHDNRSLESRVSVFRMNIHDTTSNIVMTKIRICQTNSPISGVNRSIGVKFIILKLCTQDQEFSGPSAHQNNQITIKMGRCDLYLCSSAFTMACERVYLCRQRGCVVLYDFFACFFTLLKRGSSREE
jgi:hypothetical protein